LIDSGELSNIYSIILYSTIKIYYSVKACNLSSATGVIVSERPNFTDLFEIYEVNLSLSAINDFNSLYRATAAAVAAGVEVAREERDLMLMIDGNAFHPTGDMIGDRLLLMRYDGEQVVLLPNDEEFHRRGGSCPLVARRNTYFETYEKIFGADDAGQLNLAAAWVLLGALKA
jgi:hypothetical protein